VLLHSGYCLPGLACIHSAASLALASAVARALLERSVLLACLLCLIDSEVRPVIITIKTKAMPMTKSSEVAPWGLA
jgi:hypothetical protein